MQNSHGDNNHPEHRSNVIEVGNCVQPYRASITTRQVSQRDVSSFIRVFFLYLFAEAFSESGIHRRFIMRSRNVQSPRNRVRTAIQWFYGNDDAHSGKNRGNCEEDRSIDRTRFVIESCSQRLWCYVIAFVVSKVNRPEAWLFGDISEAK